MSKVKVNSILNSCSGTGKSLGASSKIWVNALTHSFGGSGTFSYTDANFDKEFYIEIMSLLNKKKIKTKYLEFYNYLILKTEVKKITKKLISSLKKYELLFPYIYLEEISPTDRMQKIYFDKTGTLRLPPHYLKTMKDIYDQPNSVVFIMGAK